MKQKEIVNSLRILKQVIEAGFIQGKNVFVFGMGIPSDRVICYLKERGYTICGVLDNNPENWGKTFLGISVYSPTKLEEYRLNNIIVFTYSKWHTEMKKQLMKIGLSETQVICLLSDNQLPNEDSSFEAGIEKMQQSWLIYEQYREKYGEDTVFVVVPISLGDIYICCTLLDAFKTRIQQDFILMVHGKTGKKVAELFGLDNTLIISEEHMGALIQTVQIFGMDATKIYAVPVSFHYSIIDNILGYKGFNCMDLFKTALGLSAETFVMKPTAKIAGSKYHFTKKDIILIPYANSLPCFLPSFWEQLADRLCSMGYRVYTNSSNDLTEPVIEGTEKIFLSIEEMYAESNHCAGVVALRSGLCDIISSAQCKKVILYPDKGRKYGTLKDFFSLKEMGLCENATELIFEEGQETEILTDILARFEEKVL